MDTTHRHRRRRPPAAAAALVGLALGLVPASHATAATPTATTPPPSDSSPTPTTATPGSTLPPPETAPFEEAVGGAALGTVGVPVADPEADPPPTVDAMAWVVADADSGDVLAAFNAHQPRPPASTIKLLTALASRPKIDPDGEYVATDADAAVEGSRVGLAPGQTYSADDLMHGLFLASGNDAAHAVGELAGGQDAVVDLMNDEAARIGAFDTHAATPHGLDTPGQLSSAYDLALIGRHVLDDDALAELARTTVYDFPGLDGESFQIQNQNRLLDDYDGAIGLKTGFTTQGAHTLVAAAERDGRRLIAVVLGAEGRGEDSAAPLLDWGFTTGETAEPVGHLVSADEVATAIDERDNGDVLGDPFHEYEDLLNEPAATSGNVPNVVWVSLAAAVAAGGIALAVRRRPGRAARTGRYASSRRSS